MNAGRIAVGCAILFFLACARPAAARDAGTPTAAQPHTVAEMVGLLQRSVVFLGTTGSVGSGHFNGSGVILSVGGFFYLATARHVVAPANGPAPTHVFFSTKGSGLGSREISAVKSQLGVDWVMSADPNVDVALLPFGFDGTTDDIVVVPVEEGFLPPEKIQPSLETFFLSYQPGLPLISGIRPVLRRAMVSAVESNFAVLDGFTFPGNSGGPVFVRPDNARVLGGIQLGDPIAGKFVGIISGYVPYVEPAISPQTGRARIVFEENTGLMKIATTPALLALIESGPCQAQLQKLRRMGK